MGPRLIAIDIDGTLLGSNGGVSERNRAALHRAEQADIEIVIATGRRHAYAMRVLRSLGLRGENVLVSSNGAVTRTIDAQLIRRRHMPLATALWLCGAVEDLRDTLVLTFDLVGTDGDDRHGALVCEAGDALHKSIGGWMRSNEPYLRCVDRMEQALAPPRSAGSGTAVALEEPRISASESTEQENLPIQAMLCGSLERMATAEARLRQHPAVAAVGEPALSGCQITLQRTVYPQRDLTILDLLPAGCSKASALADLAASRGCTLADVLAIGDNWNDVPMLEAAGGAVLMANAPVELRELAGQKGWTLGLSNDQDGVAVAIESLLR